VQAFAIVRFLFGQALTVWCSISALISAPTSTTAIESQTQVMKPTAAPSEPYVSL